MEKTVIPDLPDLQDTAIIESVRFIACRMTANMMELAQTDFIEGVAIQTAEAFLKYAEGRKVLLYT